MRCQKLQPLFLDADKAQYQVAAVLPFDLAKSEPARLESRRVFLFSGTGIHRRILTLADACLVGACLQANVGATRAIRLQANSHKRKRPPLPQDIQETVGQQ